MLQEKYYIHNRCGEKKQELLWEKIFGYDKPLIHHMKPEKAAKMLSHLPNSTPMNQPQSQTCPSEEYWEEKV